MSGSLALGAISAGIEQGREDILRRAGIENREGRAEESHDLRMRQGAAGIEQQQQGMDIAGAQEADRTAKFQTDTETARVKQQEWVGDTGNRKKRRQKKMELESALAEQAQLKVSSQRAMQSWAVKSKNARNEAEAAQFKSETKKIMEGNEKRSLSLVFSMLQVQGGRAAAQMLNKDPSNGVDTAYDLVERFDKKTGQVTVRAVDGKGKTINDPRTGVPMEWNKAALEQHLGGGAKGGEWDVNEKGEMVIRYDNGRVKTSIGPDGKPVLAGSDISKYVKMWVDSDSEMSLNAFLSQIKAAESAGQGSGIDYGPAPDGEGWFKTNNNKTGEAGYAQKDENGRPINFRPAGAAPAGDGGPDKPSAVDPIPPAKPPAPKASPIETALERARTPGIVYGEKKAEKMAAAGRKRVEQQAARDAKHKRKVARLKSGETRARNEWTRLNDSLASRNKTPTERATIKRKMATMIKNILETQGHISELE